MSDDHADAVDELRQLGEAVAERFEPFLRLVTENTSSTESCDSCPLCLLLAMIRGERPELVLQLASKFSALVFQLQDIIDPKKPDAADAKAEPDAAPEKPAPTTPAAPRYEAIPIRLIS